MQICTLQDLVPESTSAVAEENAVVARLKASAQLATAIDPAVGLYEEPPTKGLMVETEWADLWLTPAE